MPCSLTTHNMPRQPNTMLPSPVPLRPPVPQSPSPLSQSPENYCRNAIFPFDDDWAWCSIRLDQHRAARHQMTRSTIKKTNTSNSFVLFFFVIIFPLISWSLHTDHPILTLFVYSVYSENSPVGYTSCFSPNAPNHPDLLTLWTRDLTQVVTLDRQFQFQVKILSNAQVGVECSTPPHAAP